jgi:hypothetical protein
MRDLGKMGERFFDGLCASVGITSNNSDTDKTGWDFRLEFPFNQKHEVPLDEQEAPIECKVQVKSTDNREGRWKIKLSNLIRFVKTHLPTFYLFLEYDGKDFPQHGYMVHVEETIINKVLKRLREIDVAGEEPKLNKRTLTIHYDKSHELQELSGHYLRQSIEDYIGDSFDEYVSNKRKILKTAGFDEGIGEITFSIRDEENTLELVKSSLGISGYAQINDIVWKRKRFGIISQKPQFNYSEAQLKIVDVEPKAIGRIRIKENRFSSYISLPAKLYISPLTPSIPEKYRLFRVEGTIFEFLFNPFTSHSTYKMNIDVEKHQSFIELNETAKLFMMLSKPNNKLIGELDFDIIPNKQFDIQTHSDTPNIDKDFQKSLKFVDIISTEFEIKQDLLISIPEMMNNKKAFEFFSNILTSSQGYIRAEFPVDDKLNSNDEIVCIFFNGILFGNHILGLVVSMKTQKAEMLPDNYYRVTSDVLVIERKIVVSVDETLRMDDIKSMVQETQKKYDKPGTTAISLFVD